MEQPDTTCQDDLASVQSVICGLYQSISGRAGAPRDWPRLRSLLFPGARLVRTFTDDAGRPQALIMDIDAYVGNTRQFFRENDFFEVQVACKVDRFGNIAQAFSTYEARRFPDETAPLKRGINSIQLFFDGRRWWILSILWDNEREGLRVPPEYLPQV